TRAALVDEIAPAPPSGLPPAAALPCVVRARSTHAPPRTATVTRSAPPVAPLDADLRRPKLVIEPDPPVGCGIALRSARPPARAWTLRYQRFARQDVPPGKRVMLGVGKRERRGEGHAYNRAAMTDGRRARRALMTMALMIAMPAAAIAAPAGPALAPA